MCVRVIVETSHNTLSTSPTVGPNRSPQNFALLLRDDTPHVPNEDLGEEAVLSIISNLTHIIKQVFPCKCERRKTLAIVYCSAEKITCSF